MRILIFTGNGGSGIALAAAATASTLSQAGRRTLLVSNGPSHSMDTLLGIPLTDTVQTIAPNLDAWSLNATNSLTEFWDQIRPRLSGSLAQLSGDEIPTLPGMDQALGLAYLYRQAAKDYDLIVVDTGSHDILLRVLSMPDSFRWLVRLLFGLDREPGYSVASMDRAILPANLVNLLPLDWINQIQEGRSQFERIRDYITDPSRTTVRYVLRPDSAALSQAQLAIPAFHLHSMPVDALIVGPMLPPDVHDARLSEEAGLQHEVAASAARIWHNRPVFHMLQGMTTGSPTAFAEFGSTIYDDQPPDASFGISAPIEYGSGTPPAIAINLPGVRRETLALTLSGDELIVRVGPYRRHILMPKALRGTSNIRASREGERLIVRRRE
jgi:anion-transporting  ArsA/GET3 family ATPase